MTLFITILFHKKMMIRNIQWLFEYETRTTNWFPLWNWVKPIWRKFWWLIDWNSKRCWWNWSIFWKIKKNQKLLQKIFGDILVRNWQILNLYDVKRMNMMSLLLDVPVLFLSVPDFCLVIVIPTHKWVSSGIIMP